MRERAGWWLAACAALLMLSACASAPVTRFHSLLPTQPAPAAARSVAGVSWELLPVTIPAQLNRPQMVVRLADDTLAVLEYDRWIAPLDEELRAAIRERLTYRFVPAQNGASPPDRPAPWRIRLDVLRFDAALSRGARLVAAWEVRGRARNETVLLTCRSTIEVAADGASPVGLVHAHQQAVIRLADAIAAALEKMHEGQPAACASGG